MVCFICQCHSSSTLFLIINTIHSSYYKLLQSIWWKPLKLENKWKTNLFSKIILGRRNEIKFEMTPMLREFLESSMVHIKQLRTTGVHSSPWGLLGTTVPLMNSLCYMHRWWHHYSKDRAELAWEIDMSYRDMMEWVLGGTWYHSLNTASNQNPSK